VRLIGPATAGILEVLRRLTRLGVGRAREARLQRIQPRAAAPTVGQSGLSLLKRFVSMGRRDFPQSG